MPDTVTASPQDSPFEWGQQAAFAVFVGSPKEQVVYSFIASIIAYVSTAVSAGATAFLIIIFGFTFLVGVGRLLYAMIRGE